MNRVFFDGVLEYIGKRIRYEAIANYAGNSLFKDSYKIIEENFPLKPETENKNHGLSALLGGMKINVAKDKDAAIPDWVKQAKANKKKEE